MIKSILLSNKELKRTLFCKQTSKVDMYCSHVLWEKLTNKFRMTKMRRSVKTFPKNVK